MQAVFKLIAAAALFGATIAHAETVERNTAADPKGAVEISNIAGEVRVTGWDRAEVRVKAELGRNVERLEFARDGDLTLIKVIYASGRFGSDSMLDVQVPRDSALKVVTVSAEQSIEGVNGAQRLQSVSGDIQLKALTGELHATSVSGRIAVTGAAEKTQANALTRINTVSGEIEANGLRNELELESVSGGIIATASDVARARMKTTNGEAKFTASLQRDARVEAESLNGELTVDLLGKIDAEFDIDTFNGSIDNCFGPKSERVSEFGPGRKLRFKEGAGSAYVRIKTLNGGVNLCKR